MMSSRSGTNNRPTALVAGAVGPVGGLDILWLNSGSGADMEFQKHLTYFLQMYLSS